MIKFITIKRLKLILANDLFSSNRGIVFNGSWKLVFKFCNETGLKTNQADLSTTWIYVNFFVIFSHHTLRDFLQRKAPRVHLLKGCSTKSWLWSIRKQSGLLSLQPKQLNCYNYPLLLQQIELDFRHWVTWDLNNGISVKIELKELNEL